MKYSLQNIIVNAIIALCWGGHDQARKADHAPDQRMNLNTPLINLTGDDDNGMGGGCFFVGF